MSNVEFVELTAEEQTAIDVFVKKLLTAAAESNLSDQLLLAVIANQMGDLVAMHTVKGCCALNELFDILMLNFKQGFAEYSSGGATPDFAKAMH